MLSCRTPGRQETWKDRLVNALRPLEKQRQIIAWDDRKLLPGEPWDGVIRAEVDRADIVLLLISQDFLSSSYRRDVEVRRAVEWASLGEAILIPVIVERSDWHPESFARFQSLPTDGSALAEAKDVDEALVDCRESVALACVGQWYPRRADGDGNGQGLWRLTLRAPDSSPDWPRIVRGLRTLTGEPHICFHGAGRSSADASASGGATRILFLEGPVVTKNLVHIESIDVGRFRW